VRHPDFGLTLHPFDLATNKVLALVGRTEVRDWVDMVECGRATPVEVSEALRSGGICFHEGRIRGALPEIR
jgi:hypothetical protein